MKAEQQGRDRLWTSRQLERHVGRCQVGRQGTRNGVGPSQSPPGTDWCLPFYSPLCLSAAFSQLSSTAFSWLLNFFSDFISPDTPDAMDQNVAAQIDYHPLR